MEEASRPRLSTGSINAADDKGTGAVAVAACAAGAIESTGTMPTIRAMTSNIATRPPAAFNGIVRRHGRRGTLTRTPAAADSPDVDAMIIARAAPLTMRSIARIPASTSSPVALVPPPSIARDAAVPTQVSPAVTLALTIIKITKGTTRRCKTFIALLKRAFTERGLSSVAASNAGIKHSRASDGADGIAATSAMRVPRVNRVAPGPRTRALRTNNTAATTSAATLTGSTKIVTTKSATIVSRKANIKPGKARNALSRARPTPGAPARSLSGR